MRSITVQTLFAILLIIQTTTFAQKVSFDSLLQKNTYPITLQQQRLDGAGMGILRAAASDAQFFVIAEEHNFKPLNEFSGALFAELHAQNGYNYLALEQGSVIMSWLSEGSARGNAAKIAKIVQTYPTSLTFATDDEIRLIELVGKVSTAASAPVWGVDQEFGALHLLERLSAITPDPPIHAELRRLAERARPYESDRSSEQHFLSQVADVGEYDSLVALFGNTATGEQRELLDALVRTHRIYSNNALARKGSLTGYASSFEREESMKLRFMERYRGAIASGEPLPRVMAKLGHWHVYKGIYSRSHLQTFGNFLSEFAVSNTTGAFVLSVHVVDSPETWRNTTGALAQNALATQFTLVDLRALRPFVHQDRILDLPESLGRLVFMVDAALIVRGGQTGQYTITSPSEARRRD